MILRLQHQNYSTFWKDDWLFVTSSTPAKISKAIWRRWPLMPKRGSGGPSWVPCRSLWRRANPENGGQKWKKCFIWISTGGAVHRNSRSSAQHNQDWISGFRMPNSPKYAELKNDPFGCHRFIRTNQESAVRSAPRGNPERFIENRANASWKQKWATNFGVMQASIREAL